MSERSLTTDFKNLLAAGIVRPVLFIYADLPNTKRFIWSGLGTISFKNKNWSGIGNIIEIGQVSETIDSGVQGMEIKISNPDSGLINEFDGTEYQGREVIIYLALWNAVKDTLYSMDDPLWVGFIENAELTADPDDPILVVALEHSLVDILKVRNIRYTDKDQEFLYGALTNLDDFNDLHTARFFHADYPATSSPTVGTALTLDGSGLSSSLGTGRLDTATTGTGSGLLYWSAIAGNQVSANGFGCAFLVRIDNLTIDQIIAAKWDYETNERQWLIGWNSVTQQIEFFVSSDGTVNDGVTSKSVADYFIPRGDLRAVVQCWWSPTNGEIGIQINGKRPVIASWANGILTTGTGPFCMFGLRTAAGTKGQYLTGQIDDCVFFNKEGMRNSFVREWIYQNGRFRQTADINSTETITVRDTGVSRIEQIIDTTLPWGRTAK